jgi:hypothetical protein
MSESVKRSRYVIEVCIANDREQNGRPANAGVCGNYMFPPAGRALRSRFDPACFASFDTGERLRRFMNVAGILPGEHIWIDLNKGEWGTFDPLSKPKEGSSLERRVERVQEFMKSEYTGGHYVKFARSVTSKLKSPDDTKNILYWMVRALMAGYAVVPSGEESLPSLEAVKAMPGRRKVSYGTGTRDRETAAVLEQYTDAVEIGHK